MIKTLCSAYSCTHRVSCGPSCGLSGHMAIFRL